MYAYDVEDVDNANSLATSDIIVDHRDNIAAYRLDETISRQEVVGIAMKILGTPLLDNYNCLGYFSDAYFPANHTDSWVCRSLEMAADNELVSRANSVFRPKDSITRAEALAILMKAKNFVYPKNVAETLNNQPISILYP